MSEKDVSLSDLQLAVMRVLWAEGEASVSAVYAQVGKPRGLALTTVATVLSRLEKRGVVARRAVGRGHLYRALVSEPQVRREMVRGLLSTLFQGDAGALVSHLVREKGVSERDLEAAQALLREERE